MKILPSRPCISMTSSGKEIKIEKPKAGRKSWKRCRIFRKYRERPRIQGKREKNLNLKSVGARTRCVCAASSSMKSSLTLAFSAIVIALCFIFRPSSRLFSNLWLIFRSRKNTPATYSNSTNACGVQLKKQPKSLLHASFLECVEECTSRNCTNRIANPTKPEHFTHH